MAAFAVASEGGYTVTFPSVPGAITEGDDLNEAVANAREALELVLEANAETGASLPKEVHERALAEIVAAGALPMLVSAAAPSKAVRINVTIDEGLLERINREVRALNQSRSAFLAEAARRALRPDRDDEEQVA